MATRRRIDIRIPIGTGIAGEVIRTAKPLNVPDVYASPFFNPDVDRATGFADALRSRPAGERNTTAPAANSQRDRLHRIPVLYACVAPHASPWDSR